MSSTSLGTPSERYLKQLCERTFLSLWSYAGVYRDQRVPAGPQEGKEVCDLLVVFGDHVVIFSDKECAFPDSGLIANDWSRWFRRAVIKSARQVWGAERWLLSYPNRVFLDRECSKPIPIVLPTPERAKIHRIVVAHGVAGRCRAEIGGSGSLMVVPALVGSAHLATSDAAPFPFAVGHINPSKGFVHVLDDTSLDIVLNTLDTVTDFVEYLQRKEAFVNSGRLAAAAGEEELLAWYLGKVDGRGHHDFIFPGNPSGVLLDEGLWSDFEKSDARRAKVEEDRVSYAWDRLIEQFAHHAREGTQYFSSPGGLASTERIMRFLAREPRTKRRMLARALLDIIRATPPDQRRIRVSVPLEPGDPYFVFLLLPWPHGISPEDYREVRSKFLGACCMVIELKFPNAEDIVGIATETGTSELRSEDALYLDARNWTREMNEEARRLQSELHILTEVRPFFTHEKEYPTDHTPPKIDASHIQLVARNAPCPCGSGRKYKACHGANATISRSTLSRRRRHRH